MQGFCVVVLGGIVWGNFVMCFEKNFILYILEVLLTINQLE
jgi:hypothetical protein